MNKIYVLFNEYQKVILIDFVNIFLFNFNKEYFIIDVICVILFFCGFTNFH